MMASNSQMPKWDTEAENPEHVSVIQGYKVYPCMEYQEGDCCNRYCFNYHDESTMRRPVCDSDGRLKYWSEPCEYRSRGQPCPFGYECNFAHTENETLYHPAIYKTTVVKENARPWEANQYKDKRKAALKYRKQPSYQPQHAQAVMMPENYNQPMQPHPNMQNVPMQNAPMQKPNVQNAPMQKFRLCAYYPNVDNCRRKELCSFAHSREEITAPLLTEKEEEKLDLSPEFFTERFKIHWCPIGVQHDWQTCVYAHNYQDARRDPAIGYGPRPCPFWEKKDRAPSYQARCPNGFSCPYAHGAKEQLYHPCYFKTVVCWDFHQSKKRCPRQSLCAFFHKKKLQRKQPEDLTDYEKPLKPEQMNNLQGYFKNPPFFSDEKEAMGIRGPPQQQNWGPPPNMVQPCQPCGPNGYPEMPMYCVQTPTGELSPQMSSSSAMFAPNSPADNTPMFNPTMPRFFDRDKPIFSGEDMRKMQEAPMQSPMHTPMGSPMSSGTSPMSSPMGSTPMMLVPVYAEEPYDPVPPMMMYPVDNMSMGPCPPCMPMMPNNGPFPVPDQKSGHFRGPSQLSTTAEGSSQPGTDKSDLSDHEDKMHKKEADSGAILLADLRSTAPFFVDDM